MKKRTIAIAAAAAAVIAAAGVGAVAYMLKGDAARAVNAAGLSAGEKYLAELNYTQATATLERVIAVEPNNTEAYLALAKAYRYMGDTDTARETLENGLGITDSIIIERELSELAGVSDDDGNRPAASPAAATVELAGHFYPADSTELVLRDCGLTDADLQKLSAFTNLERLDISGNGITDISEIGKVTTLKKFYAANNAIADISPLSKLPSIEYIGLRGNQIANADALFGINSLKYLHLSDNQISGVPAIGSSLQLLYLANNKIGDTAAVTGTVLLYYDVSGNAGN